MTSPVPTRKEMETVERHSEELSIINMQGQAEEFLVNQNNHEDDCRNHGNYSGSFKASHLVLSLRSSKM